MKRSVEILVHISAPSRGPDDARYRRETLDLLDFEPARRHGILSLEEEEHDVSGEGLLQKNNDEGRATSGGAADVGGDDQLSEDVDATVSSTADLTSIDVLPVTTAFPPRQIVHSSEPTESRTVKRPISHVLIERTPTIPPSHHKKLKTITSTPGGSSHRRTVSDSWETPPSVIPDSQPTPICRGRPSISSSPCLRNPINPSSSPSPTKDEDIRECKRIRVQDRVEDGVRKEIESVEKPLAKSTSTGPSKQTQLGSLRVVKTLEIHSARPHSSNDRCDSHLTQSLQMIAEKLPMKKYFTPVLQARSAEKLERGHWLVPIGSWEHTLKTKFWHFLTQFIEEGRAGWGVWCSREFLSDTGQTGSGTENTDTTVSEEAIRLYCWGELVGEIWVLLFIASERKIQGTGARWLDASQGIVVQMN